ncbi:Cof-type HAD-IIB family hydrolase [Aquimarina agarilytica]|uniref:Cof-type HAD-IIB family hydrolase n=1 Tax=Aquimarina agarilytica TaxID=1087449 RepID=UPI000288B8C2|nr:Cof-type HAD-IIB family hydrolase [Aquimarina agarilytica]
MQPKIVFSDIDGTLLNNERILSEATINQFKRIKDDIPVILISSRMPSAMVHLQKMATIEHFPIIAYNGGLILVNNKVVSTHEIANSILEQIIDFNIKTNIHLSLYNNNDWYVPKLDYWAKREINNTKTTPQILTNGKVLQLWKTEQKGAHKIMCMGDVDAIDRLYQFLEENFSNDLHLYRSKSTYIEIAPAIISKKTAVKYLLDHIYTDLSFENVAAFGDNYNDIEMLNAAGFGVAVANAKKEVLAVANHTTLTGANDGVAHFIKNNI